MVRAAEALMGMIDELKIVRSMYDYSRVIDPVTHKVMNLTRGMWEESGEDCYAFWSQNCVCDNCITVRAHREQKMFVKLQFNHGDIFLVSAVPVTIQGKQWVLELLKNVTQSMTIGDIQVSEDMAVAKMIQELNVLTVKDELTGVFNRKYINERLPADIRICQSNSQPISVMMVDLDLFKHVNDRYGHVVGDHVLRKLATLMSEEVRSGFDWVARYGGEEFLLCLPQTGLQAAKQAAERIRRRLEQAQFFAGDDSFSVTASFGICTITAPTFYDVEHVIACADNMLYRSKANGRNCVMGIPMEEYERHQRQLTKKVVPLKQTGTT